MFKSFTPIALDTGSRVIKALALEKHGSEVKLLGFSSFEKKEIKNIPGKAEQDKRDILDVLSKVQNKDAKFHPAVCLFTGKSTILKILNLAFSDSAKIEKIMKYEVMHHIHSPDKEMIYDYHIYNDAESDASSVIVGVARKDQVEKQIEELKEINLDVVSMGMSAVALFNTYKFNYDILKDQTTALIDIGAEFTNIVLERNGRILFSRTLTKGGETITRTLQRDLKTNFEQAEEIKREQGYIVFPDTAHKDEKKAKTAGIITEVMREIMNEIDHTLRFFKSETKIKDKKIKKVVLSGGTALLPGIERFFAEELGKEAELMDPFRKIKTDKEFEYLKVVAPSLSIPIGLGLNAIGEADVKINLLPAKLKLTREIKKKYKWLIPSGILLALILLVPVLSRTLDYHSLRSRLENIRPELANYEKYVPEIRKIKSENENIKKNINVFKNAVLKNKFYLDVLSYLSKSMPGNIHLKKLSVKMDRKKEKPLAVLIEGFAPSYQDLEDYVAVLETSIIFKEIQLLSTKGKLGKAGIGGQFAPAAKDNINFAISMNTEKSKPRKKRNE